jgi:mannosyltransferase
MTTTPRPRLRRTIGKPAMPQLRWLPAIAALTVLGLAVRLWGLGHQSFWYDEWLTAGEVRMSFHSMLARVRTEEVTPPLYFTAAWTWVKAFGSSEAGLRSLSAVAGALTIPVVAACAATIGSRRAAVMAAAATAFSPLLVWYSQEARSYALLTLLAALSWLFFLRLLRDGDRRDLWAWAIASAAALGIHFFGLFLVGPEIAWVAWRYRRRLEGLAACAVVIGAGLLLLRTALAVRSHGTSWIADMSRGLRLRQIAETFVAGFSPAVGLLGVAAVVAAVGVVAALARGTRSAVALAAGFAAMAVGLPLALSLFGLDYLVARNVVFALVPVTVLIALGLAALRPPWAGALALLAACLASFAATTRTQADAQLQRPDWRAVAGALGHAAGNRAIVVDGSYRGLPLLIYLGNARAMPVSQVPVREIDAIGMRSPYEVGCWWGAGCNLPSAEPASTPPAPGFRLVSRIRTGAFTIFRFAAPSSRPLGTCSSALRSPARFQGTRQHVIVLYQGTLAGRPPARRPVSARPRGRRPTYPGLRCGRSAQRRRVNRR